MADPYTPPAVVNPPVQLPNYGVTGNWFSKPTGTTYTPGGVSPTVPPKQMGGSSVEQPNISTAQKVFDNPVTNQGSAVKYFGGDTENVENTPNTQKVGMNYPVQSGTNSNLQTASSPGNSGHFRGTMYDGADDQYHNQTSSPNYLGENRAIPGVTVATDPNVIKHGTWLKIPGTEGISAHGDGIWQAHDTGSDVKSQKASGGKSPVIDFYAPGHNLNDPQYNRDFKYQQVQAPSWATTKNI